MIDKIMDLHETLVMIRVLIDQIDYYYSVNSTLIKDIQPYNAKFVLEKAEGLLASQLVKEELG